MNPLIESYKKEAEFIPNEGFYLISRNEANAIVLAFKYNLETAFYLENPNKQDFKNFAELLEVKDSNFLYLQRGSDLMVAERKDKAIYSVKLLSQEYKRSAIITTKNSVAIIAERFAENSLFDGREKEARYLKVENWYAYEEGESIAHPLENDGLKDIGKDLTPLAVLEINPKILSHLQSPAVYYSELIKDYSSIHFIENEDSELKQEVEQVLDEKIKAFFINDGKFFIEYPYTDWSKKKLKKLPFSYRFLNENLWNISLSSENKKHKEYFIHLQWVYASHTFLFDIKGFNKDLFEKLFSLINQLEHLTFGIARPMRFGENTAKSISFDYDFNGELFLSSTYKFSKQDLIEFLDSWVD